ncbi:IS701 family transposase [Streptomyces sp. NBC_00212]|uniref:IS701 family transposase n=1 Tax=Streptomyces sp. NBC_00212 TaxID=2975684 RepID=UPI0032529B3F
MTAQHGVARSESFSGFAEELFRHLPRIDQRRWAAAYVQGLLSTPGKKTVRRMAAEVTDSSTAAQALHQFINSSPWEWGPIRAELMRWAAQRTRPRCWTIAPAVLPKRGAQSCGVHRRFIPHAGRTVNCQIGFGVFLSSDTEDLPVAWSMLLPDEWSDEARRLRARIPSDVTASAEEWLLNLTDELAVHAAHGPMPVVADATGYLDAAALINGLSARGHDLVVAVPDNLLVLPGSHLAARQCPEAGPVAAVRLISEHERTGLIPQRVSAPADGRPYSMGLVHLPRPRSLPGPQHTYRLFTQPDGRGRRGGLWITNMVNQPLGDLVGLAGRRAEAAGTVGRLERNFGLRDFEGRSFPGWHHHMTLVSAAFTYARLTAHQDMRSISGFGSNSRTAPDPYTEPWRSLGRQQTQDRQTA